MSVFENDLGCDGIQVELDFIVIAPNVPETIYSKIIALSPKSEISRALESNSGHRVPDVFVSCPGQDFDEISQLRRKISFPTSLIMVGENLERHHIEEADAILNQNETKAGVQDTLRLIGSGLSKKRNQARSMDSVLTQLKKEQLKLLRLDEDLEAAKNLQRDLSANRSIEIGSIHLDFEIWAKDAIGGDLMGFFEAGPSKTGFFSFDVSGHGIASALFCARLAGQFVGNISSTNLALESKNGITQPRSPKAVLSELNMLMFSHFDTEYYATAILGNISHDTGQIQFCQAGHPQPIFFGQRFPAAPLSATGVPVGLVPGAEYENTKIVLPRNGKMLIYSDGISESESPKSAEHFGDQGLCRVLNRSHSLSNSSILKEVHSAAKRFGGGQLLDDACGMILSHRSPKN